MVFALSSIGSLLGSNTVTAGRAGTMHDAHIPDVAAVVLDDMTGAHFEMLGGLKDLSTGFLE